MCGLSLAMFSSRAVAQKVFAPAPKQTLQDSRPRVSLDSVLHIDALTSVRFEDYISRKQESTCSIRVVAPDSVALVSIDALSSEQLPGLTAAKGVYPGAYAAGSAEFVSLGNFGGPMRLRPDTLWMRPVGVLCGGYNAQNGPRLVVEYRSKLFQLEWPAFAVPTLPELGDPASGIARMTGSGGRLERLYRYSKCDTCATVFGPKSAFLEMLATSPRDRDNVVYK